VTSQAGSIRWTWTILIAAASLTLGGCSKSGPTQPSAPVAPVADTPEHALDLLVWCYDHRDVAHHRILFTEDYVFDFALVDTVTGTFRDSSMTRDQELIYANHLFATGVGILPAATSIALTLGPPIVPIPDGRPGKDPTVHKEASVTSNLVADFVGASVQIRSPVKFYLVRGDSAAVPPELVALGALRDSTRWYVEGWVEELSRPVGTRAAARSLEALETFDATWGEFKLLFLSGPPALPRSSAARPPVPRARAWPAAASPTPRAPARPAATSPPGR